MSPDLDLEAVPVKIVNVNFDGLNRTKSDFVSPAVKEVFHAKSFGELILRVGEAQDKLSKLETFKNVSTIIDVTKTVPKSDVTTAGGDEYDITFVVQEMGRIAASAKTQMGAQADAQIKTGLRMPNLFGRGERLEMEYSYSSGEERNTEISYMKPFPFVLDSSLKTSIFQLKSANILSNFLNTAVGSLLSFNCGHYTNLASIAIHHKLEWEAIWRQLTPSSMSTPFSIRMECGHSFKSAVRHQVTLDNRNRQVFPSQGFWASFLQELAGLGGDVKYHKVDVDLQHNILLPLSMVFQTSFRTGIITPLDTTDKSCGIVDRFFMGGPSTLRGFSMRGINVGSDGFALGGKAHWSAAAHLYTPLPAMNHKFPMIDSCRLHLFVNAGNLADTFFRDKIFRDACLAYGIGLAMALGDFGRLEMNYCWPTKYSTRDKPIRGLQFGVGVHFL